MSEAPEIPEDILEEAGAFMWARLDGKVPAPVCQVVGKQLLKHIWLHVGASWGEWYYAKAGAETIIAELEGENE